MLKKIVVIFVLLFVLLTSTSGCKKATVSSEHTHQGMTEQSEHNH